MWVGPGTRLAGVLLASSVAAGCGGDSTDPAGPPGSSPTAPGSAEAARFPDVREVVLVPEGEEEFTVEVTLSSPYDSPERYADAWRVVAGDRVLGVRELAHDHAGEQPFTRSLGGVRIPAGVTEVTVEGRDSESGYGGGTLTVPVPGR